MVVGDIGGAIPEVVEMVAAFSLPMTPNILDTGNAETLVENKASNRRQK